MGLYPRNAENNAPVGGMEPRVAATDARFAEPRLAREFETAFGNAPWMPKITIVKNTAMLAVFAELNNVDIMPDATPRSSGGTEFMIEELFGDANIPLP